MRISKQREFDRRASRNESFTIAIALRPFESLGQGAVLQRLVANGGAIVARVGGATALVGFGVDTNGVDQSDMAAALYFVAAGLHLVLHIGAEQTFHPENIGEPLVVEAWRVDRGLRVHAEAHPVEDR